MNKILKILLTISILSVANYAVAEEKDGFNVTFKKDLEEIRSNLKKIAEQAKSEKKYKQLIHKYRELQQKYETALVEKAELTDSVEYLSNSSKKSISYSQDKINKLNSTIKELRTENITLKSQVRDLKQFNKETYDEVSQELKELRRVLLNQE